MVVDSSVWIEILTDGKLRQRCEDELKKARPVRVPALVIHEIYKKIKSLASEEQALEVVAMLSQYEVLDLNREIAITAADLSLSENLAMADSIVLAHAHFLNDKLLTLDNDFASLPQVHILRGSD